MTRGARAGCPAGANRPGLHGGPQRACRCDPPPPPRRRPNVTEAAVTAAGSSRRRPSAARTRIVGRQDRHPTGWHPLGRPGPPEPGHAVGPRQRPTPTRTRVRTRGATLFGPPRPGQPCPPRPGAPDCGPAGPCPPARPSARSKAHKPARRPGRAIKRGPACAHARSPAGQPDAVLSLSLRNVLLSLSLPLRAVSLPAAAGTAARRPRAAGVDSPSR